MFGIGLPELLIILLILLLLFGSKRLPELSKSVGESLKELRKGLTEDTISKEKDATPKKEVKKEDKV